MSAVAAVLGGSGFIGTHVCAALHRAGYDVVSAGRRGVSPLHGVRAVRLDLAAADTRALDTFFRRERPAVVVNAAGAVWAGGEDLMTELNARLVTRVAAALGELAWRPRFVQLGSAHEYGGRAGRIALSESDTERPTTVYGRTKLLGTEAVRDRGDVDGVVLRVTNALGAGVPPASLPGRVGAQLRAAGAGPAVLRLAPLTAWCDFVDVRDSADAVVRAAGSAARAGVVNIGSGVATPVRSAVDTLIEISGVPAEVLEAPEPDTHRSSGITWQAVDISRAAEVLGWRPSRSLRTSLRDGWEAASVSLC